MLRRLEINNLAVISHCVFEPCAGLNVLSGETGAGKSLLIDAIEMILGAKASRDLVRTGSDKAFIEAVFDLEDRSVSEVRTILDEAGIPFEDDQLIVSREISSDGKSVARINGRSCVLSVLSGVTSALVDIHGQNDTQKIFNENTHGLLLDRFIGEEAFTLLDRYRSKLAEYKDIVLRMRELGSSPEANARRREYLSFAVEEIRRAGFKPGEEESLHNEKKILADRVKIETLLQGVSEILKDNQIYELSGLMNKLSSTDPSFEEMKDRAESLVLEASALEADIDSRLGSDMYSGSRLDEIDGRISLLFDLKSKYGETVEAINGFADEAELEISEIDDSGKTLAKLKKSRQAAEAELLKVAGELSELRHKKAQELSSRIVTELAELEMPGCVFEVGFKEHAKDRFFSSNGTEDIRFMMSANKGQELRPLSKIASGGEASRIMLAIKTILSVADDTPTMIFDEIDSGISGAAALKVAEKLKFISGSHQVLSVTHTARIAAAADVNHFISKREGSTDISILDREGKMAEVSRLLSGTADLASLGLAAELISQYQ